MSDVHQGLAHSKWDYKYHVVFVPIFGQVAANALAVSWA
jgi:hypothetical protein